MIPPEEIAKRCYLRRTVNEELIKVVRHYDITGFVNELQQTLEGIITIANNPQEYEGSFSRSSRYLKHFEEKTGIKFEKNPFCAYLFHANLGIYLVFLIIKECKDLGYMESLPQIQDNESQVVCAYRLIDPARNHDFKLLKKKRYGRT